MLLVRVGCVDEIITLLFNVSWHPNVAITTFVVFDDNGLVATEEPILKHITQAAALLSILFPQLGPINGLNHADTINIVSRVVIKLTILDQSARNNAGSLKAHPSNSVRQGFHCSALTLVSFLSGAVATVVTVLATETTLALVAAPFFTSGTSSKTFSVLLKAAGVPVGDVLVIINVVNLVVVFDTVGCLLLFLEGLKPLVLPSFGIRLNAILSTDLGTFS